VLSNKPTDTHAHQNYRIGIQGNLPGGWEDWFDGFEIVQKEADVIFLSGRIVDQAALHGLLAKIRDWGLPLLLVEKMERMEEDHENREKELG
jgi:hypothetical protein